ncbi:Ubiquitin thioesterase otubain-like [Capsicum annuum]|nr:Ubiquitin thioesterase otubain-like [Capsicum annuum]
MFFRFVTSGEIRKRSEFFEPFVLGLTNASVEQLFVVPVMLELPGVNPPPYLKTQFCKSAVEPMSEESDHVQIIALSDALGVPIRVVYLDRSSCENNSINVNHHDFIPTSSEVGNSDVSKTTNPSITLLYRPGHYDILYPK